MMHLSLCTKHSPTINHFLGKLIYNPKQKMGFDAAYYTVQEPLWRKFLSHRNRVKLAIDSLYS